MKQAAIGKIKRPVAINVLHVRSTIGMYGAEKVILNLMGAFKSAISHIQVNASVAIIEGPNEESQTFAKLLNKHDLAHDSIISKKRLDFNAIKHLHSVMKYKKISVVHTHDYKSLLFVVFATLLSSKKIIHHIHGALGNTRAERIYAVIERICMVRANQIITVSQNQKNILLDNRFFKNKVIQVNNGTVLPFEATDRTNPEYHSMGEGFTIIMVARFTPEKNHSLAIDVLNELIISKKIKPVQLLLLGDGPNYQAIKSQVEKYNLQKNIQLIGFSNNVQGWLEKSDLLLITSTTEGMPMCLLEAMAIGLPTVSTSVGEIPHLLTQSQSGLLANNKKSLVQSINTLMEDETLYQQCSRNAQAYSKKHLSVQNQAQVLADIYQQSINKSGSKDT